MDSLSESWQRLSREEKHDKNPESGNSDAMTVELWH
jgi:hypothetical protein